MTGNQPPEDGRYARDRAAPEEGAADLGVPYPDMVYEAEAAQEPPQAAPAGREPYPGREDAPAQTAYPAFPQGGVMETGAPMPIGGMLARPDYPLDEDEPPSSALLPVQPAAAARSGGGLWTLTALVCAALLAGMGLFVWNLYQGWQPFREKVRLVSGDRIAQGVSIDQVLVGGMTRQEAIGALGGENQPQTVALAITLQAEDSVWIITEQELPLTRNIQDMVDAAWSIGRQGSPATIASSITPFEYRWRHLYHNAENPTALSTSLTYDRDRVRALVDQAADHVDREPVDAAVSFFDPYACAFAFSDEKAGVRVDREALVRRITEELDQKRYTAVIRIPTQILTPRVTKADLIGSYGKIASYTTETTPNENRNVNIYLAAKAITGKAVMPGETFSFNAATQERTAEKGYMPAAAIADGASVEEVGGGVCQVSSTLYNAAAMADMTIVERSPHTWPSTYVEMGRDATVNWPDLDFCFRNDRSGPVFIVAKYADLQCTVDIYGPSLGPGVSIELITRLVSETPPPSDPVYVFNGELPYGTVREKKKARTGYEVETYRVYLQDGVETRRELLRPSSYPMIQQVLEYNY